MSRKIIKFVRFIGDRSYVKKDSNIVKTNSFSEKDKLQYYIRYKIVIENCFFSVVIIALFRSDVPAQRLEFQ